MSVASAAYDASLNHNLVFAIGGAEAMSSGIVYVIDDDREIRLSLSFQLSTLGYKVYPFVAAADFLEQCADLTPGCIVLDIRMSGMDGAQALVAMRQRGIDWPVIVMTGHAEVSVAVDVMKNGALDFLEKPFEDHELQTALQRGFSRLEDDRAQAERMRRAKERLARLSPRERDVFRLMLGGEANKVIAHKLDLSIRTIEMHRANVLAKMETRNVTEAAVMLGGRLP